MGASTWVAYMADDYQTIEWSYDEETGVGRIILDRPDAMNALSTQLREDVIAGIEAFEAIDEEAAGVAVRMVVLEGAGDTAFCAGADIEEFDAAQPGVFDPSDLYSTVAAYGAPIIAQIDGYCLGGGLELALACDFRYASERSELGQPEIDLGIIPGGGGTQRLPRIVGTSRAKELCMTGSHLQASEAAAEGIVDAVHPQEELDAAVSEFVETVCEKPPLAVRAVKDTVEMSQRTGLREGLRYEHRAFRMLQGTADHEEGVAAFSEKRAPEFEGR